MLILARESQLLEEQLKGITEIIQSLSFILNEKKRVTTLQRRIEFLGFVVDTVQMTLSLPPEKTAKLQKECRHASNQGHQTARQLAHLIGVMISCIPAVLPALQGSSEIEMEALGPPGLIKTMQSHCQLRHYKIWIARLPLNASQPILPVSLVMSLETNASSLLHQDLHRGSVVQIKGSPQLT